MKLRTYLIRKLKEDDEFLIMALGNYMIHKEELMKERAKEGYKEFIEEMKEELHKEIKDTEAWDKKLSMYIKEKIE